MQQNTVFLLCNLANLLLLPDNKIYMQINMLSLSSLQLLFFTE